jgi:hypothetical protein
MIKHQGNCPNSDRNKPTPDNNPAKLDKKPTNTSDKNDRN